MTPTVLGLLLFGVGMLLFCVSALESALLALREHRISTISEGDGGVEGHLRELFAVKESRLGQVLVLSALCNTGMAALGLLLVRELEEVWSISKISRGVIVFATLIVLCQLLPNVFAKLRPRWIFSVIAPPVLLLAKFVMPFEAGLHAVAKWVTNRLVPASVQPSRSLMDEELGTLVEMRRDEGTLENVEGEVIHEILKLGDKTAKDCMTPRVDCVALANDLPAGEADRSIREQTHRKIPIYDGTPDAIIGVLDVTGFLQSGDVDFQSHVHPPTFAPEMLSAIDLFDRHLKTADDLVIVLDEFGGFEGVVTRSDIIEDLVEDVAPAEEPEIQELGNGRFLVSGSARLDELQEVTHIELEAEGLDTIGGFIATQLGRIPSPGESLRFEKIQVVVRKSTGKRVEELLLATGRSSRP